MKITKWKVLQKDSSIGLLLLIVSFFAFLLIVLGPTTIGVDVAQTKDITINGQPLPWNGGKTFVRYTLGATNGDGTNMWSNTGEALAVIGMVFAGISWLTICVGWYFDPTKLDERITLSISAATILIAMVFAIAGPAYENHYWTSKGYDTNNGYLAGMEILAIVPSVLTMLLMIEPLMMVFNPKYVSKAEQHIQAEEKQEAKKVTK